MLESNSSCSPFDNKDYVVVAGLSAAIAGVSLVLLVAVICMLILFKKLHEFSQRLILYLALASILVEVSIILHRLDYENQKSEFYVRFCQFGGYFSENAIWMLLMSVCSIVVYASLRILFNKNTARLELVYLFFIFIFPLTFTWVPFVYNAYGRAGAWCWIKSEIRNGTCQPYYTGQVLQYLMWFGPLCVILVILLIIYFVLLVHQCHKRLKMKAEKSVHVSGMYSNSDLVGQQDFLMLTVYPVLYFVLNLFPLANRSFDIATDRGPSLVLWYFSALAYPLMGSLVTLAYFLDPETRKRLSMRHIHGAVVDLFKKNDMINSYSVTIPDNAIRTDSYNCQHSYAINRRDDNAHVSSKCLHWKTNFRA